MDDELLRQQIIEILQNAGSSSTKEDLNIAVMNMLEILPPPVSDFKLHMLASKTCCKDRWRQVISEADRIKPKHLFTLQEGVSSNQLNEMYQNGIVLVVPQPIMSSFPADYRDKIMNLTGFVEYIRNNQA